MLLTNLINSLQSDYATIQSQIDSLQEQQRQIQVKLQRIGSVESKMEAATQVLMEAIAGIRDVCPEEIDGFQQTITSLFSGDAIASLPSYKEEDVEVEAVEVETTVDEVEVEAVEVETTVDEVEVEAVEVETTVDEVEVEAVEVETTVEDDFAKEDQLRSLSIQQLRKLGSEKGIGGGGTKAAIAYRLGGLVTATEFESLGKAA